MIHSFKLLRAFVCSPVQIHSFCYFNNLRNFPYFLIGFQCILTSIGLLPELISIFFVFWYVDLFYCVQLVLQRSYPFLVNFMANPFGFFFEEIAFVWIYSISCFFQFRHCFTYFHFVFFQVSFVF